MLTSLLDVFNATMLSLSYVIISLFIEAICEEQKRQNFLLQPSSSWLAICAFFIVCIPNVATSTCLLMCDLDIPLIFAFLAALIALANRNLIKISTIFASYLFLSRFASCLFIWICLICATASASSSIGDN